MPDLPDLTRRKSRHTYLSRVCGSKRGEGLDKMRGVFEALFLRCQSGRGDLLGSAWDICEDTADAMAWTPRRQQLSSFGSKQLRARVSTLFQGACSSTTMHLLPTSLAGIWKWPVVGEELGGRSTAIAIAMRRNYLDPA